MQELKPCPFCGAVPQTQTNLEEDTFMYYIACCHCNLAGVKSYDKEIAIERWNTRHYPPMDELIQHFKNLEEDETLKRIDDAYNRGWNYAMNNPEVKKALERMEPKKVIERWKQNNIEFGDCPNCICPVERKEWNEHPHCERCGQRLDWSE